MIHTAENELAVWDSQVNLGHYRSSEIQTEIITSQDRRRRLLFTRGRSVYVAVGLPVQ